MLLKVIAYGIIMNPNSYLRDFWNILDFSIIVIGYISIFINNLVNLSFIRTIRVLRPLRTFKFVKGLNILLTSLISSIPLLRDTTIVLLFFMILMSIAGLQLFMGSLHNR